MSKSSASSMSKVTDCGQTIDESWNSLVNYQMTILRAPNKHNNLYQSPLKDTVISLQSMTLHYEILYSVFLKHTFLNPENEDFLSNKVWMMFPQHDLITASRQSLMECNATNMLSSPWRVSTFWIISSKWDSIVRATLNTVSRIWSLSWQHVKIGYSLFSTSSARKKIITFNFKTIIFFLSDHESQISTKFVKLKV